MRGYLRRSTIGQRLHGDEGFGLIEVIVSGVVLIVLALATLSLIDGSTSTAASNRARVSASNLAHEALNAMRQKPFSALADYSEAKDVQLGGLTYKVVSKAVWTRDAGDEVSCTSTGASAQYLRISATVTWANMGQVKPVTAESLATPRQSDIDPTVGTLVVTVNDADGNPINGATVTAQGQSLVTNENGCVIFARLKAGSSDVTYYFSNYVDQNGSSPGVKNVSIVAGQISSISPTLGAPVAINVSFKRDPNAGPVATSHWMSASAINDQIAPVLQPRNAQSNPRPWGNSTTGLTVSGLFPFPAGYTVYAGSCTGNDPSTWVSNAAAKYPASSVAPPGGGTGAATAYLKRSRLRISGLTSDATTTRDVHVLIKPTGAQMAGCSETLETTFKAQSTDFIQDVDLPFGTWQVCVDSYVDVQRRVWDWSKWGYVWVTDQVLSKVTSGTYNVMPAGTPTSGSPADSTGSPLALSLPASESAKCV